MNMQQNVSLAQYSTMGLGGRAAYLVEVQTRMEVLEALSWANDRKLASIMIGSGSNIVWRDEGFSGLVIADRIERYEVFEEDDTNVYLTIGSGNNWDAVVARTVAAGLSGIEALSLIPGSTGATPIQNVGAYGQEIADTLVTIEAFDMRIHDFITIAASDCAFGYRTSRFKTTDHGRFFITSITLHLMRTNPQPPFYPAVTNYLTEHGIATYTPATIREAVIAIRSAKLPDPTIIHNNGSFFANPIVTTSQLVQIQADTDLQVPHWPTETGSVKLSAAWLIERVGFKDFHDLKTGMATWPAQPLVLINEHAKSTSDLLAFRQKIVDAVQTKFSVTLEQEPELLP